jgi:probable HAF family extracellular repeat protein
MKMKRQPTLIIITVIILLFRFTPIGFATPVTFQGLGIGTEAYDVSADGKVVVGTDGTQAFRWTATEGIQHLGSGIAYGVSADGSVIVGESQGNEAFRWTIDGGMVGLGFLPYDNCSSASGVSNDGSIVVGWSQCTYAYQPNNKEVFLWTAETGLVGLGGLPGHSSSMAYAVSSDGSVVVGTADSSDCSGWCMITPGCEAFLWTAADGFVPLGDLIGCVGIGGNCLSGALDVSDDGSVIAGFSVDVPLSNIEKAAIWTANEGMVGLGSLHGWSLEFSYCTAISGDGSVAVGYSYDYDTEAFLWTANGGMVSIKEMLENQYGLNLSGWALNHATGISADGLTIVGYDTNPDGLTKGWVVTIPEPSTLLLLGLGSLALRRCSRQALMRRRRA